MTIHIGKDISEVNQLFIDYFLDIANSCIAKNDRFNWVLTGGNSPKKVYSLLAEQYATALDWSKVFFFFGDERYVPIDSDEYNGKMAKLSLLEPLKINANQIFYIPTHSSPALDAQNYQAQIDLHFNVLEPAERTQIQFDLIMLGMGDDAHTASLFPHTSAIHHHEPEIISLWVEKLKTHRITFSAPLINQAKAIAFLCFGSNKAVALKNVWNKQSQDYERFPSQMINPKSGELHWFIDEALDEAIKTN